MAACDQILLVLLFDWEEITTHYWYTTVLMEEILNRLGCIKPCNTVTNGINLNYIYYQLAVDFVHQQYCISISNSITN